MSVDPSALSPSRRSTALAIMSAEPIDVVVIGGGVTGAGAALDAASRGLNVGLVEQRDYASGTSSRSSKMFHGGLRYLEQLNFRLVREALSERNLMIRHICPHLARPVAFLYPLEHRFWERPYVGAGIALYDVLANLASNPLPAHRHIWRRELAEMAPALDPKAAHGAVLYWDVVVDDARHTMTVGRTAAAHGASLASSARVVGIEPGPELVSIEVVDLESDRPFFIRSRTVINATGVWTDEIQELVGGGIPDVKPSKGVHLVVPRERIRSETGLILRTEASVLFVIPWGEHWIVGTTDTPWQLGLAHPAASRSDIDYLLGWVNTVLADPLTPEDVVGVYAGLRPLLAGESDETSRLSREHAVIDDGSRMITVAGGKYTTYRVMAKDAVDALSPYLGDLAPSVTERLPMAGADGYEKARSSAPPDQVSAADHERLLGRYGANVRDLYALIGADSSLADRVVTDAPYLRAEIDYAVTHEGALHLDDVLTRRTRLSIETTHRGLDAADEVARIMGGHLGWEADSVERELHHYRARVEAEIDSQRQPDDRTADAARMGAPDVRTADRS